MPHPLSNTLGVRGAGGGPASRDGWSELPGVFLLLRDSLSLQSFPAQLWAFSLLWLPGWDTFSPLWGSTILSHCQRARPGHPSPDSQASLCPLAGWNSPPRHTNQEMLTPFFARHRNAALFLALAPCPSHYTLLSMNLPRSASCFPKSLEPQECAQVTFTWALPTFLPQSPLLLVHTRFGHTHTLQNVSPEFSSWS